MQREALAAYKAAWLLAHPGRNAGALRRLRRLRRREGVRPVMTPPLTAAGMFPTRPRGRRSAGTFARKFAWKGELRRLCLDPSDLPNSCPSHLRGLIGWLMERARRDLPADGAQALPRHAEAARVSGLRAPLVEVQRWCRGAGWFDLAVLVVDRDGRPEAGLLGDGADCRDAGEWREYLGRAVHALGCAN